MLMSISELQDMRKQLVHQLDEAIEIKIKLVGEFGSSAYISILMNEVVDKIRYKMVVIDNQLSRLLDVKHEVDLK